jgi:hypothetical protein
MQNFKVTYVRPSGDSTWLYLIVSAPSTFVARKIAEAQLTGLRILNVVPA